MTPPLRNAVTCQHTTCNSRDGPHLTSSVPRALHTVQPCPQGGTDDVAFCNWLAGVTDGDGNFDFRRGSVRAIRIKMHVRDVRILKFIQHRSHMGRVRTVSRSNYVLWIVSHRAHMASFLRLINGRMRVKVPSFVRACAALGVPYEPAPVLEPWNAYLAGLIDSEGWVGLNYAQNCITVGVELTRSPGVVDLNLDHVIPYAKPCTFVRTTASGKLSTRSIWHNVHGMGPVLAYFRAHRLHSDFKYRRVLRIGRFLGLRHYKNCPHGSVGQRLYSAFCVDFLSYQNPSWTKVPWVAKLDKDIVHKLTQSHACISTTC